MTSTTASYTATIIQVCNGRWTKEVVELQNLVAVPKYKGERFIFAKSKDIRAINGSPSLCKQYGIPSSFWSQTCEELNGFFGASVSHDASRSILKHRTWLKLIVKHVRRFDNTEDEYHWDEMRFFSLWTPEQNLLLCLDCPLGLDDNLLSTLRSESVTSATIFSLHAAVLEQVVILYDRSIWNISRTIRQIEKARTPNASKHSWQNSSHIQPEGNEISLEPSTFPTLHDLARHTAHSVETVTVASDTIGRLIRHMEQLRSKVENRPADPATAPAATAPTAEDIEHQLEILRFQHSMLSSLTERSRSNEKRLSNEINLMFNLVTLRDSKVIQLDSSAMKAIAIVTTMFLPATFLAAIFSMSFFNYNPPDNGGSDGVWSVSHKIWIYFAVAIPVTLLSLVFGHVWRKRVDRKPERPLFVAPRRSNTVEPKSSSSSSSSAVVAAKGVQMSKLGSADSPV